MNASLTMVDVPITVPIQQGVIIVNVLMDIFFNLMTMTVLKKVNINLMVARYTKAGHR